MKRIVAIIIVSMLGICAFGQHLQPVEGFTVHSVKWFEDLSSISASYGVPADIIMKVNGLSSKKLSTRQELYIPTEEKYWTTVLVAAAESNDEEAETATSIGESDDPSLFHGLDNNKEDSTVFSAPCGNGKARMALLLPMKDRRNAMQGNNLDFYSGVLMAARDLGTEGIDIELNVFDYSKGFADNTGIEQNDFMVGPIRSEDIENVIDIFDRNTIVVSPLDQKAERLVKNHPNLVQAPTGQSEQYYGAIGAEDDNYIIITSEADTTALREARTALESNGIGYSICYCNVSKELEGWDKAYSQKKHNRVIVAVTNEAILNNAIRNIGLYTDKGDITAYCNSKVRSYATIPVENIHNAGIHALCTYYIDYTDSRTLAFIHRYRALFNTEPSQFAFQGYDICYFLCKTYAKYGKAWKDLITEEPEMHLLQSDYKMKRIADGGLVNSGVRSVVYNSDFSVSLEN